MIRPTGDLFYILMYQNFDGELYWWGLFDSPEAAAEDGPQCYESQIDKDVTIEEKTKIVEKLLEYKKYSDESDFLTLWIDQAVLCTNKEK